MISDTQYNNHLLEEMAQVLFLRVTNGLMSNRSRNVLVIFL